MKIIDGHAHACGMFLNASDTVRYMKVNNIYKMVLSAGEPDSDKIYRLPYMARWFRSSRLIYMNNALTSMIIKLSKMNQYIDQGKSRSQVKKFISLTKKYQGVTFILAHLIGIEEFDRSIGNNVYYDISCPLLHSTKMLEKAWKNFGAERILLGSDAPYGTDNIKLAISQMHEVGMNDDEIELICSKNIEKLLGIN